ncbi:nucleoside-diphosphate sugar epimerase [Nannochloropsis gaditana]|uniref:Nucleoside-diphosphate sugar epimerase n=2 Tax=Nannochloropsis gaditana TaxID=72520 RepID=W7TTL8_9STRA|nr:nucleoside-diphosphate sugar epimerase [Nannochloropsis gaditana]
MPGNRRSFLTTALVFVLLPYLATSFSLAAPYRMRSISTGPTRTGTVSSISATSSTTSSPVDQIMGFFNTGAKGSVTNLSLGGGKKEYTVVITGASGMIGRALTKALQGGTIAGKSVKVVEISRRSGATSWDPATGAINAAALEGADAVVHLAGENVGSGSSESLTGRLGAWTEQKKERILNSRRDGTALLVRTIQGLKNPPKVFLTASAVGYYGFDEGDRVFDETGALGKGFLAEVTRVWEAEAAKLQGKRGIRVVNARFGVVLSKEGGIIKKLLPIFQLGGGGIIGDGQQYLSWISLTDAVRAIQFLLGASRLSGPVNVVAPEPATNAEFTAAMGKALFRPTILPFPAPAAQLLFGEMGDEMLLGGQKAIPKKLLAAGFTFEDPDILSGVQSALKN